jgi:serine/threonine-protein kinase
MVGETVRLGRLVALRFLSPQLVRDPDAKRRFVQEARTASALDHANICTIHNIEETADGRVFISRSPRTSWDGSTATSAACSSVPTRYETTVIEAL